MLSDDEFDVLAGIMIGDLKPFTKLLRRPDADFSFLSKGGFAELLADMLDGKPNSVGVIFEKKNDGHHSQTGAFKNKQKREMIRIGKILKSAGVDSKTNMRVFDNVRAENDDIIQKDRTLESIKSSYEAHLVEQKVRDEQLLELSQNYEQSKNIFAEVKAEMEALRALKSSKPYPEISEELNTRMEILEQKLSDKLRTDY